METQDEKIARVVQEEITLVPYDPSWPEMFRCEREHLLSCLPQEIVKRIEHFGSTAIPGLTAKPIIDILVEVTGLDETRTTVVPILESQGYEYFWRPTWGDDTPPFYAWFIKSDGSGQRSHHIHMVEADFEHWDRLFFRDYLREYSGIAREYYELKQKLVRATRYDRIGYTEAKSNFVRAITEKAKKYYTGQLQG